MADRQLRVCGEPLIPTLATQRPRAVASQIVTTAATGQVDAERGVFFIARAGDEVDTVFAAEDGVRCTPLATGLGLAVYTGRQRGRVNVRSDVLETPPTDGDLDEWDMCQALSLKLDGPACCLDNIMQDKALADGDLLLAHGWTRFGVRARGRDYLSHAPMDQPIGSILIEPWPEEGESVPTLVGTDQGIPAGQGPPTGTDSVPS